MMTPQRKCLLSINMLDSPWNLGQPAFTVPREDKACLIVFLQKFPSFVMQPKNKTKLTNKVWRGLLHHVTHKMIIIFCLIYMKAAFGLYIYWALHVGWFVCAINVTCRMWTFKTWDSVGQLQLQIIIKKQNIDTQN